MTLAEIRTEIDRIDTQMKKLFLNRMAMSKQVAKAKAVTGGDVYVAEREREIIDKHAGDVERTLYPQYAAFLKHVMGVSRTYQYSLLEGMQRKNLDMLPQEQGEITFCFCPAQGMLHQYVEAVEFSDLVIEEMSLEKTKDMKQLCRMRLSGVFSNPLAKAAILQILKETELFQIERRES